ncbi:MAG: PaaI family thioesterase [Proteobacteria bacterium]|nr:PaaI family thioesterase [Pseudomonadota bacterium]
MSGGSLMKRLAEARKHRDVGQLAEAIPYARWMQIAPENGTGELLTRMRYHDSLIGNTFLPAIHGGTLGALLEMAAIFHLLWETEAETVPKIVNITVDYLRSARPLDVIASAKVTKQGRRMVNVFAEAWQDDRSKPVATAQAHFLVTAADEPSVL